MTLPSAREFNLRRSVMSSKSWGKWLTLNINPASRKNLLWTHNVWKVSEAVCGLQIIEVYSSIESIKAQQSVLIVILSFQSEAALIEKPRTNTYHFNKSFRIKWILNLKQGFKT